MSNPTQLLWFNKSHRLPIILQTEAAECGLACLAMISTYHGHKMDLNSARQRFPISLKGTNLQTVMDIADRLELSTRALRVELEDLASLKTPCILHWDFNHFVVLKYADAKKIIIHDPDSGERHYPLSRASKHFTGIAVEFTPTKSFEKQDAKIKFPLSHLWSRIQGIKRVLVQLFVLSLLLQLFAIVSPFFLQLVVDHVVVGFDKTLLVALALGFLLLAFIQVGTETFREYIVMYLGSQLNIQMASNLIRHLLRLPLTYFERRHIGDIVSRFTSIDAIKQLITTGLIESIVDGIMAIGTLIMMFIYSPKLATIVLITMAIYTAIRFSLYRPMRRLTEDAIVAHAKENSNFMETVKAIQSIKIFSRESQRQAVWQNHYAEALNSDIHLNKLKITYKSIGKLLFGIESVAVIYFGAGLILENIFSVGMLFTFIFYKRQFGETAVAVIEKAIEFKMLNLHLERLADIALTDTEKDEQRSLIKRPITQGSLRLENLSFQYAQGEANIFENLNIAINAGESVAITGPSGCGKTTLAKVMLGLLTPNTGNIYFGDVNISNLGLTNYRSHLGAVMQDDQLLSGSLMDNITFFDTQADEDFAITCAQQASIHEDIMNMPMDYNSLIGDMGTTLSGGQRQRLLLARALYRKPKILFLDEATSALDTTLESAVNASIKDLNITRVIIAHRPETIRSADRVLRLQHGKLVEIDFEQSLTPKKQAQTCQQDNGECLPEPA